MKILALDSTAVAASVALCEDDALLAEYTLQNGNTHSQTLLPMVESILDAFELSADEITELLTYKKLGYLRTIKNCLVYFVTLTIIGFCAYLIILSQSF